MSSSSNNINSNKYGSLPEIYTNNSDIEGEEHGTYPIENTQYIVSTAEESRRKCVNASIPVMLFVVLMSSIAFALSRDFNHLYPGRGGDPSSSTSKTNANGGSASKHSWVSEDVETTTAPESTAHVSSKPTSGTINNVKDVQNAEAQDNSHADCSFHNKCIAANLTGICCPTPEDVLLDCCN